MRPLHAWAMALSTATLLTQCAYDFDAICREGEICDPAGLTAPAVGEPDIAHVTACNMLLGTCPTAGTNTACRFVITGNSVDAEPQCTAMRGSVTRDRPCSDTMQCDLGLTCVRASTSVEGLCRDLCTTLADCTSTAVGGQTMTCDRSRPVATIGAVTLYACAPVSTSLTTR